jgi:hypothetical protein
MIGWILRMLLFRFARRAGPVGLLTLLGGPFPRLAMMLLALRFVSRRPGKIA